jgi:O-antigen/teichoic acid export membrane protein
LIQLSSDSKKEISSGSNTIQAFWVAISSLSSILISIGSAAILARYFSKADLGTYKQILYVYGSLLIIFSAGLPSIYSYYLPRYTRGQGLSIVKSISGLLFLCGIFFSLTLFFGAGLFAELLSNPDIEEGLRLFSIIPLLLLPTLGLEGVFVSYQLTYILPIYNTVTRLLMLFCIVAPIIIFGSQIEYAIYGWIVASIITLVIAYFIIKIPFKGNLATGSDLSYKAILAYSMPIMGASLAGMAINSSDQFYISRYFGQEIFAEFSNGFIQLPFVGMVVGSASAVIMPKLSSYFAKLNGDKSQILMLWQSMTIKSALILYPLIVLFFYFSDYFVVLLYSDLYEASSDYFKIKLVANLFNIILFGPMLLASGNSKYYMNLHIVFAILTWTLQYIGILIFNDPYITASISVFLMIALIAVGYIKIKKILEVDYLEIFPITIMAKIAAHCSVSILIAVTLINCFPVNDHSMFLKVGLSTIVYILILISSSYLLNIDYLKSYTPLFNRIKSILKIT